MIIDVEIHSLRFQRRPQILQQRELQKLQGMTEEFSPDYTSKNQYNRTIMCPRDNCTPILPFIRHKDMNPETGNPLETGTRYWKYSRRVKGGEEVTLPFTSLRSRPV